MSVPAAPVEPESLTLTFGTSKPSTAWSAAGLVAAPAPLTAVSPPSSLSSVLTSEQMLVASLAPHALQTEHRRSLQLNQKTVPGTPLRLRLKRPFGGDSPESAPRDHLELWQLVTVVDEPLLSDPAPRRNKCREQDGHVA